MAQSEPVFDPSQVRISASLADALAGGPVVVGTLNRAKCDAVRQALDFTSTARAIAVCAIGFPVYALSLILSILVLGPWPV